MAGRLMRLEIYTQKIFLMTITHRIINMREPMQIMKKIMETAGLGVLFWKEAIMSKSCPVRKGMNFLWETKGIL